MKKKKELEATQRSLNGMVANMSIQDQSRRPSERSSETSSFDSRNRRSDDSNQSQSRYPIDPTHQRPLANGQDQRPSDTAVPNFSSRRPYQGQDHAAQDRQRPGWQQGRPGPPLPPLETHSQYEYQNQSQASHHGTPISPRNDSLGRNMQANPNTFGGWNFPSQPGSHAHGAFPPRGQSNGPSAPYFYGGNADPYPQAPRSAVTPSDRPAMAPRAHSDETAYNQSQTGPMDSAPAN